MQAFCGSRKLPLQSMFEYEYYEYYIMSMFVSFLSGSMKGILSKGIVSLQSKEKGIIFVVIP